MFSSVYKIQRRCLGKRKYFLNSTIDICVSMYELVFKSIKNELRHYFSIEGVVPCVGSYIISYVSEVFYMQFI
jgi:hypothetical protein